MELDTCNHCSSKRVELQVWGRTQFYSCLDCKLEVTAAPPQPKSAEWTASKHYGTSTYSTADDCMYTLPVGWTVEGSDLKEQQLTFEDWIKNEK